MDWGERSNLKRLLPLRSQGDAHPHYLSPELIGHLARSEGEMPAGRHRQEKSRPKGGGFDYWWSRSESNRRPPECHSLSVGSPWSNEVDPIRSELFVRAWFCLQFVYHV